MFEGMIRYFTLNHMDDKKVGSNGKIISFPALKPIWATSASFTA